MKLFFFQPAWLFVRPIIFLSGLFAAALQPAFADSEVEATRMILHDGDNQFSLQAGVLEYDILKISNQQFMSHLVDYYYFVYAEVSDPGEISGKQVVLVPIVEKNLSQRPMLKTSTLSEQTNPNIEIFKVSKNHQVGFVLIEITKVDINGDDSKYIINAYSLCKFSDARFTGQTISFVSSGMKETPSSFYSNHDMDDDIISTAKTYSTCFY